jgi:hypothetical protein
VRNSEMKKKKLKKPRMSEEEYMRTHLRGMDETRKRWYMNTMKTWTKEDYENYGKFHLCMLGGLDEEAWEPDD